MEHKATFNSESRTRWAERLRAAPSWTGVVDTMLAELIEITGDWNDQVLTKDLCETFEEACAEQGVTPTNRSTFTRVLAKKAKEQGKEIWNQKGRAHGLRVRDGEPKAKRK